MADEETQHGISVQNHSPVAPGADHAVSSHWPSNTWISDVAMTMPSAAIFTETSDAQGSCISDPIAFKSLIELDSVGFSTGVDQQKSADSARFVTTEPEDEAVTSVSGETTSLAISSSRSSNCCANASNPPSAESLGFSDHDGVNTHVGDNATCGSYPSNGDTTRQPASV